MVVKTTYQNEITVELVKLLYRQLIFGVLGEMCAAVGVLFALWGYVNTRILCAWFVLTIIFCGLARSALIFLFKHKKKDKTLTYFEAKYWLRFFIIGVTFSGISWGFAGSFLMIQNDAMRQIFVMILLFGIVSAANPLYSPNRRASLIFLLFSFIPFATWLFWQGGLMIILGILALVYMAVMAGISLYSHNVFFSSWLLGFEKNSLIQNLSIAKKDLELRTYELEKSVALGKATLESTTDGILVVNLNNKIESFNQKFISMWHLPYLSISNKDVSVLIDLMSKQLVEQNSFSAKLADANKHYKNDSFEEIYFKDERIFECYSHPQNIGEKNVGRVWSFRDITSKKIMEDKLFRQANYDTLTDLPNRALAMDRLSRAITYAKQHTASIATIFLDVDRFKLINDTLGHPVGDKLLIATARRLLKCVSSNDTVSREGGDEFLIILNYYHNESYLIDTVNKILNTMSEMFLIEGHKLSSTMSIGISSYPKDGDNAEVLIGNADIAMYRAKELGRNNFQFFTYGMNKRANSRLSLESKLRDALRLNELYLTYQPIIDLNQGAIISLEALLRWSHPEFKSIDILEVISVAEETGLIMPIGDWVIRTACCQIKNAFPAKFTGRIAVNISPRQFNQANFLGRLEEIFYETKVDPTRLSFEITENVVMDDIEGTIKLLNKIKKLGMLVVIDDFGTGYSSLNYLKRLPVDKVKIDRSFIKDLSPHTDDATITSAIIALARQLHIKVIAEGVETEAQLKFLMNHHCDEAQGNLFSKSLDVEKCFDYIKDEKNFLFDFLKN